MEMRHHEVGIRQGQIDGHVTEEQARQAAMDKREDKANREQHRHPEVDVALPECQYPVIDFDGRRHRDDQGRGCEEKPEVRIHTADIHVVSPDDETQAADRNDGPNHHAETKNIFSRAYSSASVTSKKSRALLMAGISGVVTNTIKSDVSSTLITVS